MEGENSEPPTESEDIDHVLEEAWELIDLSGLHRGQIIHACVKLGVFEHLGQGERSPDEVANELDVDTDQTYRLLRALASMDVLSEDADRNFSLTTLGAVFQSEHPQSLADPALFYHSPQVVTAFTHLPELVREESTDGFECEFGQPFYDYIDQNSEFGDVYNDTMGRVMADETDAVLDALDSYDFSNMQELCDVGGGYGHLLCHLLAAHPRLRGTVFDLPSVVAEDDRHVAPEVGVEDRCAYVGGDMFDSVPVADAYFMKHVLDNWTDEQSVEILSTIHDAAPPDARVFVIEYLFPEREAPEELSLIDIHQFAVLGGGVRTKQELRSQMDDAGWELIDVWAPDEGALRVVEGKRA